MQCGKVTDVRLIKTNKAGKGNVYAYVEFASTKGVEKALRLDRSMLTGRPMFVSPFKEKRSGDYGSTTQKVSESGEEVVEWEGEEVDEKVEREEVGEDKKG